MAASTVVANPGAGGAEFLTHKVGDPHTPVGKTAFGDADTVTPVEDADTKRLPVKVGDPLPAGTNNIGDVDVASLPALPAGNNNIGDVDVASLPAGSLAGGPAKTLDYDTGAGTETVSAVGILLPKSGGAVAGGTASDPLRVDPTGTTTQPVSAAALPLPAGAATGAKQDTAIALLGGGLPSALASDRLKVDGSGVTQPVSAAALPLPAGAATSAKQDTLIGHVDGLEGLLAGGLPAALAANGGLKIEGVAGGVVVPVADGGGSLTVDGTVTAANAAGDVAHDGADGGNPVKIGAVARTTAFPTAVSAAGDRVNVMADHFGRLIVANVPHQLRLIGKLNRTDNNAADIIAAQGSGFVIVVTSIVVTCAHATVGTKVSIRDGTTVKEVHFAAANGGGWAHAEGGQELFRSSDNAAITGICGTTGSDVDITVIGYKAPA